MSEIVLDASAIVAALKFEKGGDVARGLGRAALVSVVNHAEVLSHFVRAGRSLESARQACAKLTYGIVPFDEPQALEGARLVRFTHDAGLSLADRACLALAKLRGLEVVTADRAWTKLQIGVTIRAIR